MRKKIIAFYDVLLLSVICGPLMICSILIFVFGKLHDLEWILKYWYLVILFAVGIMLPIGCSLMIRYISINNKNRKFIPLLIVSILLMIVGVYTILIGDIILSNIGIIMMIYAVIEIIGYIFYTKDTKPVEEPGTTTLIVQEETIEEEQPKKKNKKKIKDVKEKQKK